MKTYESDYMIALAKAHEDEKAYQMVESLIKNHFAMIEHMKKTSLYDIYEYENRLAQPIEILAYENEKLKKEVNDLRKQLGLISKYKE